MAAPMDLASVDAIGVRSVQVALDAAGSAAAADARANAARLVVRRSQAERNRDYCRETVALGIAEAARQFLFLMSDKMLETHGSAAAYVAYVNGKLTGKKKLAYSTYKKKYKEFWALAHGYSVTTRGGVTIERVALDMETWTDGNCNGKSKYAELSTLEFVLAEGFGEALLEKILPGGKSVTALINDANGWEAASKPKATRRPKKVPAEPAETTEAAETTPPKAKAPARRARRRGRRHEDEDEIETAVSEAALAPAGTKTAELVDLMADNKMLRRDLATRDEEIAALKASLQKKGEEIEETNLYFQERIEALEDELAREKDKNKTGRRQTAVSPLSDATNA